VLALVALPSRERTIAPAGLEPAAA
jgi:hypothetical protein